MQLAMDSSTGGMQRVKVYRLNTEGMWDDKGTGSVSVEYMEVSRALPPHDHSAHAGSLVAMDASIE